MEQERVHGDPAPLHRCQYHKENEAVREVSVLVWFLLIFIIIDVIQTIYIKHLKKEISMRDKEYENKPVIKKENRLLKIIKEIFWI